MEREIRVSDILAEVSRLVGDTRRDVGTFIVVIGGLGVLGVLLGFSEVSDPAVGFGVRVDTFEGPGSAAFSLVSSIVSVVAGYLLLTRYLAARGRMHEGGTRFWHYIAMAILSGLAIAVGLIFLLVPGLFLAVRWSAASGFVIGAREGIIGSLRASWEATKGHGGQIFLAGLVLLIAIIAAGVVAGIFAAISANLGAIVGAFLEASVNAVLLAFGIAVYCLVHRDAREIGEVFS